jgi:hypothetical protein
MKAEVPTAYERYWCRKKLMKQIPAFPRRHWWPTEGLSQGDQICFDAVRNAAHILDFGAGDLRIQRKFVAAGYAGEYHTLDIGNEFPYTFSDLDQVEHSYEAILCLDVIEHLALEAGLGLMERLAQLLSPGGVLIIQTPNAVCIRNPWGWDMTHIQCYNVADLWACLTSMGLETHGYRISLRQQPGNPIAWLGYRLKIWLTGLLGCDDCENILMIGRKPAFSA